MNDTFPRKMTAALLCCFALTHLHTNAEAQEKPAAIDSTYLEDHANDLILRVYGSHKFTRLSYGNYDKDEKAVFKPNSNYNIGVGFNYKFLGINLGFRMPGVNNDNDRFGKTKYLDLQAYVYARKLTIDFYAQTYEGYYLNNTKELNAAPAGQEYLLRSDIQTRNLGANVEYIFNNKRFSYRAIYLQNERQKKSAGSFLLGGGIHFLNVRADSAVLPRAFDNSAFAGLDNFNRSSTASLALNGGYGHTFVIQEKFFIMGSVLAGIGADYLQTKNVADNQQSDYFLYLSGLLRLGAGYNSDRFYAGIYFTTNAMRTSYANAQQYETGLLRVAVAKRFIRIPKAVRLIDKAGALVGIK